jgi:type VI protein secretion system component VasK
MSNIQRQVYPNNSPVPRFEYTVFAHLPELGGYKSEKLLFDGQTLEVGETGKSAKFSWPATGTPGAVLSLSIGAGDIDQQTEQGTWAVARFFSNYRWTAGENGYRIEGPLRGPTGQPQTVNGKVITIRFDVDFSGVPLFEAGYLSALSCPASMEH